MSGIGETLMIISGTYLCIYLLDWFVSARAKRREDRIRALVSNYVVFHFKRGRDMDGHS